MGARGGSAAQRLRIDEGVNGVFLRSLVYYPGRCVPAHHADPQGMYVGLDAAHRASGLFAPPFLRCLPADRQDPRDAQVLVRSDAAMDPGGWIHGAAQGDAPLLQVGRPVISFVDLSLKIGSHGGPYPPKWGTPSSSAPTPIVSPDSGPSISGTTFLTPAAPYCARCAI